MTKKPVYDNCFILNVLELKYKYTENGTTVQDAGVLINNIYIGRSLHVNMCVCNSFKNTTINFTI